MTARLVRARPRELAALVLCLALAVATVVGVATQDSYTPDRTIEGLVLDGGPTTTGPVSVLPPPVQHIPRREIGDDGSPSVGKHVPLLDLVDQRERTIHPLD